MDYPKEKIDKIIDLLREERINLDHRYNNI